MIEIVFRNGGVAHYKPSEPQTDALQDWKDRMWAEAIVTEPTISKMEQVEDEPRAEGVWNAGYKTGYDKGYKDAQKVKDSQDLVKDLVKVFCEDGTWLERQGVYTLTLAEAKQRAVDIIESVLAKDEPQTDDIGDCNICKYVGLEHRCNQCVNGSMFCKVEDEPQTDCDHRCVQTEIGCEQTDCAWK